MKQSYDLLKYIHCYLYNYEAESVCFAESPDRSDAIEAYHRFAQEHNIYENDLRLWMYDVALDCIRTLPKEQWELFLDVEDPILLHFEYGMYIRNHYIYCSRLHEENWHADRLSHIAIDLMQTILRPIAHKS